MPARQPPGRNQPHGLTSLVLPGGGARGAYQVGVLKGIGEIAENGDNPFPIVVGTSVGAINAAAVASYAGAYREKIGRLEELWGALSAGSVYVTDFLPLAKRSAHWLAAITLGGLGVGNPISLLDNAPLGKLLEETVDYDGIAAAIAAGALRAVAVSASGYGDGRVETFFQGADELEGWVRSRRDGVKARLATEHLMASASLPFLFPARKIGDEYYGDGSLRLTAPLSPAIRLGASRILVIGVRDKMRSIKDTQPEYPSLGDLAGYMIDIAFNDNLDNDIERLCRINHTLSMISAEVREKTHLRRVAIKSIMPSSDLRAIAGEHADSLPWTIKALLKSVGAWRGNWRMPSFLLFEKPYVDALIDLGYRDALAQKDEIRGFLAGDEDDEAFG